MSDLNQSEWKPTDELSVVGRRARSNGHGSGSTGPRTEEGKEKSSNNSTTHGCTSKPAKLLIKNGYLTPEARDRIVLPDESVEEWDALLEHWYEEYVPEGGLQVELVVKAAIADWMMRRTLRRYDQAEQRLYKAQVDPTAWSEEEHKLLERFLRYRNTAERSFFRARAAVEQARRIQGNKLEREPKEAAESNKAAPKKDGSALPAGVEELERKAQTGGYLFQCVTVQVIEGRTLTIFAPQSENFERMVASAKEPQPMVRRALYFMHGIPEEYSWVTDYENLEERPHYVIERSCEETLADLARERREGGGHLLRVRPRSL